MASQIAGTGAISGHDGWVVTDDLNNRLLTLCDDLWRGGERLHASFLYQAAFTGFGTERAYETLNALKAVRADRGAVERLDLSDPLTTLIIEMEPAINEPLGVIQSDRQ